MGKSNRIGKAGEELGFAQIVIKEGAAAKVTRTGRGHDFKAERYDVFTGETHETFYEVKAGEHPQLSELQKKTQAELGEKYVVQKVHLPFNKDLY